MMDKHAGTNGRYKQKDADSKKEFLKNALNQNHCDRNAE